MKILETEPNVHDYDYVDVFDSHQEAKEWAERMEKATSFHRMFNGDFKVFGKAVYGKRKY